MSFDLINQTPDTIAAGVTIFLDAAIEAANAGDTARAEELLENARWQSEKMAEYIVAVAQENHELRHTDIATLRQRLWETEESALAILEERDHLLRGIERLKYGYRITEDDHPDVQRAHMAAKASAIDEIAANLASLVGLVPEDVRDFIQSMLDGEADWYAATELLEALLEQGRAE